MEMQTYGNIVYCFMRQYSFYFDIQSVRAWLHARSGSRPFGCIEIRHCMGLSESSNND
jgi:hypothetical protein